MRLAWAWTADERKARASGFEGHSLHDAALLDSIRLDKAGLEVGLLFLDRREVHWLLQLWRPAEPTVNLWWVPIARS
jgi:hypothetical protein